MHTIVQSAFLQALGWAIVQSIWQLSALWLCYFVISRIFLSGNARMRYLLGCITLFTGTAWFLFTLTVNIITGTTTPVGLNMNEGLVFHQFYTPLSALISKTAPYLSVLYLLLLIGGAYRFFAGLKYVNLIRNQGLEKIPVEWRLFTENTATVLEIRRKVKIWLSEMVGTPVTVGFLKPVILIPVSMLNNLSTVQLEAIILHELSHIKRNDYLLNLCLTIAEALLFFHPFAHLLRKEIRKNREFICDDMVLQFRYDASVYATALVQAEQQRLRLLQSRFGMAAFTEKEALLERVHRMLGNTRNLPRRKFTGVLGLALALLTTLFVAAPVAEETKETTDFAANILTVPASESISATGSRERPLLIKSILNTPIAEEEVPEPKSTPVPQSSTADLVVIPITKPAEPVALPEQQLKVYQVANHEITLEINGQQFTANALASSYTRADSMAMFVAEIQNRIAEQDRLMAKARLKELRRRIDWESLAHAQSEGKETVKALEKEIEKALAESNWKEVQQYFSNQTDKPKKVEISNQALVIVDSVFTLSNSDVKLKKIVVKKVKPIVKL